MKNTAQNHDQDLIKSEFIDILQGINSFLLDKTSGMITINKLHDLKYEYANSAAFKALGYSRDELYSQRVYDLVHCDDINKIKIALKKYLPKGEGQIEFRCRRKDGSYIWLEVQGKLIDDEDSEPAILSISRDITTFKETTNEHNAVFTDHCADKHIKTSLKYNLISEKFLLKMAQDIDNAEKEEIDKVIESSLKTFGKLYCCDRGYICLFSKDGSLMSITHEWCKDGIYAQRNNLQNVPVDNLPGWIEKIKNRDDICIQRVSALPHELQTGKEILLQSTQSLFITPLALENRVLGFIGFDSVIKEKSWHNVTILKLTAQIIANAMQRREYDMDLEKADNYFHTVFENAAAPTIIIEDDMSISMINEEARNLLQGYSDDSGSLIWTCFIPEHMQEKMKENHCRRLEDPNSVPRKYPAQVIDNRGIIRDGLITVDIIPGTKSSVVIFTDLTDYKAMDRALRAISEVNMAVFYTASEEELLSEVCQRIAEIGGYSLVWIGYVQEDPSGKVKPVAHAGRDHGYLNKLNIALTDPKRGAGPDGKAIQSGHRVIMRKFKEYPSFKPWFKAAARRGFRSVMSIPLMDGNVSFGVLSIYSDEVECFDYKEEQLLLQLTNNLAYAVTALRAGKERDRITKELGISLEKTQQILMQTVTSLGTVVDIKDPYTAGHQRKVAHLAQAIAQEMKLDKEKIEGIGVAGNLHDIGKIIVPSEILNKPGRLSDIEFETIKSHCKASYEIVKDIEFPWPVAEIILQHHERMDGSGYPQRLAGDEILLEARIMAVADVVEAMITQRSYRGSLGIEAALEEINKKSGIEFDSDVVEACIRLFKDKDYNFQNNL